VPPAQHRTRPLRLEEPGPPPRSTMGITPSWPPPTAASSQQNRPQHSSN